MHNTNTAVSKHCQNTFIVNGNRNQQHCPTSWMATFIGFNYDHTLKPVLLFKSHISPQMYHPWKYQKIYWLMPEHSIPKCSLWRCNPKWIFHTYWCTMYYDCQKVWQIFIVWLYVHSTIVTLYIAMHYPLMLFA